jgi:hypothetical protein
MSLLVDGGASKEARQLAGFSPKSSENPRTCVTAGRAATLRL